MRQEELERWLVEQEIETVVAAGVDTHGVLRGKRLPAERFVATLEHGVALSDVFWVMDLAEAELVERPTGQVTYFPAREEGYPDVYLVPDPATLRPMPWHERTALALGSFRRHDGAPVPIDPRVALAAAVERVRALGLEPMVGVELEFYLLRESSASLAAKGFTSLEPLEPRPYTYGVLGGSLNEPLLGRLRRLLAEHGVPVEAANPETGPGQFEVNLRYGPAQRAADDAMLLKHAVKEVAAQEGLLATFMAKPVTSWAGSSCHLHLSLRRDGRNAFWDGSAQAESEVLRRCVAGVLATMPELTAFLAPTPNAYRRFHPYSWAGSTATWAFENRSTGLRVVLEGEAGTRLEHRQAGGDANPYLAVAAMLAGCVHGLELGLEPPPPLAGDAYALGPADAPPLPRTLEAALALLEQSDRARELLGPDLVEHFVACKQAEVEAARAAVTDWEVRRYVELL